MRVTKQKSAANRRALIEAADELFRSRGIDGVGVSEIGKRAGLSQGAIYAQFGSKDGLVAAALDHGLRSDLASMAAATKTEAPDLRDYVDHYLASERGVGLATCIASGLASRESLESHAADEPCLEGMRRMIELLESAVIGDGSAEERRALSTFVFAAMLGASLIGRAVGRTQPALSDEMLSAVRMQIGRIAVADRTG